MLHRYLYTALVWLLFPAALCAQNSKYVFTRLSVKDGLASNHVHSILQDRKGFMWLATASGLQRYDGRKVIMFHSPAGSGEYLPASGISQIFEDVQHNFWVRYGSEVGIFDPVTFRFRKAVVQLKDSVPPRAEHYLWSDSRGNIFLIITQYGVLAYNAAANTFATDTTRFRAPANWKVGKLMEDKQTGNYWIATDSGLAMYDVTHKSLHYAGHGTTGLPVLEVPYFHDPITSVFIDRQRRFWIASWNPVRGGEHFFCYDLTTNKLLPDTAGLVAHNEYYKELHQFTQQSTGKLWAYGRMMLLEYDPQQHRFQYMRNEHLDDYGLKYDVIHCMYEDQEKNIWLGTDEGVYIFNPTHQLFTNTVLPTPPKKQLPPVKAFLQTGQKQLMVATWGLGTYLYDSNLAILSGNLAAGRPVNDNSYDLQWAIHEDSHSGVIWVGCQVGRMIIYNPKTKRSQFYRIPEAEDRTIRQVIEDKKGTIWIGTQYGQLIKWDPAAGYEKGFLSGFRVIQRLGTIIYKIKTDREGFLWVCTHMKGLYKIDPASGNIVAHYDTKGGDGRSLQSDLVTDIVPYKDSLLFVADGSLDVLNKYTGAVRQFTVDDGLPSISVRTLELDNDNNLWIGLQNGICRYNPVKNTFTLFTQKDGITETDFELNASMKMRDGKLLFGNPHNFICFQPKSFFNSAVPPDVTITDFKLFNTYLPPDSIMKLGKVQLDYTQNSITIEFAALSFLQRDKISYYYKMEGINDEWIRTERGLFANYPLLPPGDYTFKVASENADGIGSANITTLAIHISPPFWRTWWFLTLVFLAIAALVYFIHRQRVNRLLSMEKVRSRIARDLHDDMGSTLSTINILSVMAKMKVSSDAAKTSEFLQKISDNSNRMMEAMDDIVWSINPMNDSMQRIAARMREFATGVLEARNIDYIFRVDEQVIDLKLDMEARRDIFLLFKEAVNNLAKYSECKHAVIDISIQKHVMQMKIADDGIGFDLNNVDSGNGLTNMRKRAQSLGAQLIIQSELNKGTTVLLKVSLT